MSSESGLMDAIREKVEAGQRLSFEDGLALEASNDLFALGAMANLVRERYNGNFGYYNVNTHINPTNVCVYTCDFCAFRADLGEARAYVMDRDQIVERARQASARGATELHIVGGLHHKLPFQLLRRRRPLDQGDCARDPHQGLHGRRDRVVLQDRAASRSSRCSSELIDAGLGQPAGRRCRDLPSRGPRANLRGQGLDRELAQRPPHAPTGWACTPTPPCSTAISTGPSIGSTTWSACASSRTRPAGSRRSSRWRSIPTIPRWPISPSRRA